MSDTIKIPKGWRKLRVGEVMRKDDYWWPRTPPHEWTPQGYDGDRLRHDEQVTIRRVNKFARKNPNPMVRS